MTAHTKGGFHVKREEYGHVESTFLFLSYFWVSSNQGHLSSWALRDKKSRWMSDKCLLWSQRCCLRIQNTEHFSWFWFWYCSAEDWTPRHAYMRQALHPEYEATPSSDIVRRITMTREKQAARWREITVTCGLSPDASFCLLCSRACHEAWAHMPPAWLHTASVLHVAACSHIAYHYGHHIRQATNHLAAICNKINWDRKATAVYFLASCGTKVEMGKGMCSLGEDGKEKDTSILRKDPKVMGK